MLAQHKVKFSPWASAEIKTWPKAVRIDLATIIRELENGRSVPFPDTRHMGVVATGCFEIRIRGFDGIYRALYVVRRPFGIVVFHAFKKKSQKTPQQEIETGRQRLKMFLQRLDPDEEKK